MIANIDSELALKERAAGTQAVSQFLTATSNDAVGADEEQHVIFTLDGASYSFPITSVTEIVRPLAITPLPNVPEWMAGVANLRGDIISVVDLRRFFGLGEDEALRRGRMQVVRSKSEEIQTSWLMPCAVFASSTVLMFSR
jgi:chemotaxis signal transduction protein